MSRVLFEADQAYPVLAVYPVPEDDTEFGIDVPDELLAANNAAWAAVEATEGALLDWLQGQEPDHPIFHHFPRDPSEG